MSTTKGKVPARNGLIDIASGEFMKNPLLPAEALEEKLRSLPVDPKVYPQLAHEIQVIKELLFAFGTRRYGAISLLAMVDLLQAVDYFLVLGDQNPDSRVDGYSDDAEVVHRACVKHEIELRAFRQWSSKQH
jgi:hypothetical protein